MIHFPLTVEEQEALVRQVDQEQDASDRLFHFVRGFEAKVDVNDDGSYSMVLPSINDRIIKDNKLLVKVDFIPEASRDVKTVIWLGEDVFEAGARAELEWLAWLGGCRIFNDAEGYYYEIPCFEGSEADEYRKVGRQLGKSEEQIQATLDFENEKTRLGRTLEESVKLLRQAVKASFS
jgi:hypothetical protein